MRHRGRMLAVLDRAETGPMVDEKQFEAKVLAPAVKRLVAQYGIKFDRAAVVPHDDEMADRLFAAGLALATEVGMLCTDTSRLITWSCREYEEGLKYAPDEAVMGAGQDGVVIRPRHPGCVSAPLTVGGAFGITIPEAMYVPVMLSYAQEPSLDAIDNGTLECVYGRTIKASSPWEALAGWREVELSMEVLQRAGRQGLCVACVENASTALGEISASSWGGFRPTDLHHIAAVSELKTNYDALSKLVHTTRIGGALVGFAAAIFGGYLGGPEGTALGLVAAGIILNQNYLPSLIGLSSVHPFLGCTTTPEILWAYGLMSQALSRNTHLLYTSLVRPAGGPATKTLLYEMAAFALTTTTSGHPLLEASMTATGTHPSHCSGLEAKFCAEVAHAAAGMSREHANEMVLHLLDLYEPQLKQRPIGKPFHEVYDVVTIRPTAEWQGMYDEVGDELIAMGLPLHEH